jgi:hypothetical protein
MSVRMRVPRLAMPLLAAPLLAVSLVAAPLLTTAPAQADSVSPPATQSATAQAAPTQAAVKQAASAQASATQSGKTQTVTTLTGGQLQVGSGGTDVVESGGPTLSYVAADGDRYVVPASAAPYVGRQLSWSLFDVSAQVRDHITGGAKIPVSLSLTSAGASPPPGITLTSSSGTSAHGYLTASSAPKLAAYLRGQIAADVAAGRPAGSTPLPGLANMTLAADAPSQPATSSDTYDIVQFNTPGLSGEANAIIQLYDMDSFETLSTTVDSYDGIARIAVPAGHYYAIAQFTDYDAQGNLTALRYVTDGFTVPDSTNMVTVNLDEATASTLSTAITPRPAQQINQVITWGLEDATGTWSTTTLTVAGPTGTDDEGDAGTDVYVAPDRSGPSAGRLRYIVQWDGIAPQSGGTYPYADESSYAYRYDVAFGWNNEIPAGPYLVEPGQLATVTDDVYADPDETPAAFEFSKAPVDPVLPSAASVQPSDLWLRVAPGDFTDYVGTADGGEWMFNAGVGPGDTLYSDSDDPQTYAAGREYSVDWGRGPLAPEWGQHTPRPTALYQNCEACVAESATGDYLVALYPTNSQDSQQISYGNRDLNETGACYINGTEVIDAPVCVDNPAFTPGVAPSSKLNTYRLVLDTSLMPGGPTYGQANPTQTDLTFRYQYKTSPPRDMTLPSGYECEQQTAPGTCEILPVLTLNYQLAENELNTSDASVQTMKLDVGHETFDGIGSHAPITSASVEVSFDGGTTWQDASLDGRDGDYTATWRNPASAWGTQPDLKVTATDSIGGSITQVIDSAYDFGPAPASTSQPAAPPAQQTADVKAPCAAPAAGHASCMVLVRTDVHGGLGVRGPAARAAGEDAAAAAPPAGFGPSDLQSAYNLPSTGGSGQTIAVVDAYDDPTAEADLAVYRATYGLPACTTANGCFTKVNEEGQQDDYPADDTYTGWSLETSLDLDMVSASCPDCHILLVEANSTTDADLAAAEDTAARLGATEISNSYGGDESDEMLQYESAYSHPGIAITASSGDGGFGVPQFPAVASSVIAVGGTSLEQDSGTARGWTETAWDQSGSGCSAWVAKPAWQTAVPECPGRVTADVAADADPDTGAVAVYDSTPDIDASPGWLEAGGTSAASPFIAGVIALAGNPGALPNASYIYAHSGDLYDVTSGSNGAPGFDCGGDSLCTAGPGYDGPTGLGTPDGTGSF